MARVVQTITIRPIPDHHDAIMADLKAYKTYMESRGATVSVAYALESGPNWGRTTIATTWPSAADWAKAVDDTSPEMMEIRRKSIASGDVLDASLLQLVDL